MSNGLRLIHSMPNAKPNVMSLITSLICDDIDLVNSVYKESTTYNGGDIAIIIRDERFHVGVCLADGVTGAYDETKWAFRSLFREFDELNKKVNDLENKLQNFIDIHGNLPVSGGTFNDPYYQNP